MVYFTAKLIYSILKGRLRFLKQYTWVNNIEFSGVQVTQKESVIDRLKDINVVLGV